MQSCDGLLKCQSCHAAWGCSLRLSYHLWLVDSDTTCRFPAESIQPDVDPSGNAFNLATSIVVAHSRSVPGTFRRRHRTRKLEQQLVPFFRIQSNVRDKRFNLVVLPSWARQEQLCKACSGICRERGRGKVTQSRARGVARVSKVVALAFCMSAGPPKRGRERRTESSWSETADSNASPTAFFHLVMNSVSSMGSCFAHDAMSTGEEGRSDERRVPCSV